MRQTFQASFQQTKNSRMYWQLNGQIFGFCCGVAQTPGPFGIHQISASTTQSWRKPVLLVGISKKKVNFLFL